MSVIHKGAAYLAKPHFAKSESVIQESAKPNHTLLSHTLLNQFQENAITYSAKQEYGKSPFRNLQNHTLINRNLIKQEKGIC